MGWAISKLVAAFSWIVIDVRGSHPLWVMSSLGRWSRVILKSKPC